MGVNSDRALKNADAMILVTEWKTFRKPDFKRMGQLMNHKIIFDGRNQYDPEEMSEYGFDYHGIGREPLGPGYRVYYSRIGPVVFILLCLTALDVKIEIVAS